MTVFLLFHRLRVALLLDRVRYFETVSINRCPHGDMNYRHSISILFFFIEEQLHPCDEGFAMPVYGDLVDEAEEGLAHVDGVAVVQGVEDLGGAGFGLGAGGDGDGLGLLRFEPLFSPSVSPLTQFIPSGKFHYIVINY